MVLVAIALLGAFGYLMFKNKDLFKSKRSTAVLVVTTILALILLGIWASGQISSNIDVCGVCGGSGSFLGKSCNGCYGTGYAIENSYDVWWCFWVALAVMGVGFLVAVPGRREAVGTHIEFVGKILGAYTGQILCVDNNGAFVNIEPQSGAPWRKTSYGGDARCYLSDDSHKAFVVKKKLGDVVTIKGTILSVDGITRTNSYVMYNVNVTEISD